MKGVFLFGDSIRLGYERYIKAMFDGVANVYAPAQNCGLAQFVQRWVHVWAHNEGVPRDVDVVHWNAGLWDALRLMGDEPLTPTDIYARFIARIDQRLRMLFPKAKMIFATSTSVYEPGFAGLNHERRNADIAERNAAAIEALAGTDTIINDLYTLSLSLPNEARSDATHFNNDEGCRYMGSFVTCALARALDIDPTTLPAVDAKAQTIAADILGY